MDKIYRQIMKIQERFSDISYLPKGFIVVNSSTAQ